MSLENSSTIIGALMGASKLKYSLMVDKIEEIESIVKCDELLIYINIDSLFNSGFSTYGNTILEVNDVLNDPYYEHLITSELINFAGHYRNFFWSNYNLPTMFIMYYSDRHPKCDDSIDIHLGLQKYIAKNLDYASMVAKYIPGVYITSTAGIPTSQFPAVCDFKMDDILKGMNKLLISGNDADLQYVGLSESNYYYHSTTMKSGSIVKDTTFMDELDRKVKLKNPLPDIGGAGMLPYLYAIAGSMNYGVHPLEGYTILKACKFLNSLDDFVYTHVIADKINDPQFIINFNKLLMNGKVDNYYYEFARCLANFIDLVTEAAIYKLNKSTKFKNYPINTDMLLKGQQIA